MYRGQRRYVVPATVTSVSRSISSGHGITLYPNVAPPPALHLPFSILNSHLNLHLVNICSTTQCSTMPISKKEARKLKSNRKVAPSKAEEFQSLDKKSYVPDEQIESGDEDDQDVSEEGMKRLMELVDVDDLNEYEIALLGAEQDEEEEGEGSEGEEAEISAGESVDEDEEEEGQNEVRFSLFSLSFTLKDGMETGQHHSQ